MSELYPLILQEIRVPWPPNMPNDGWPRPPKRIIWMRLRAESLRGPCGLCARPVVAQVSVDGWPGLYDEDGHEHVCIREEIKRR